MWYRVFGSSEAPPEPAALLEHLHHADFPVRAHFRGDDQGWFAATLLFEDDAEPIQLERYLATEEGIRADLNTWAAWLEAVSDNPHSERLMPLVIGTQQLFTLHSPEDDGEVLAASLCACLCRFLARETAGVYQADQQGFCAPDGTVLVPETE